MNERDKWRALVIFLILFMAYSEADSWFWRNQIRDLQRRVGQLEQQVKHQ